MKKRSLITKLALSGVALAATAATLATSTYAWYTSNTSVDASNVIAGSADSGDSSILISTTGTGGWSQSVKYAENAFASVGLIPLQIQEDGSLKKFGSSTEIGASAGEKEYLEFTLYFKTSKTTDNVPLYLKSMTIVNSAELPKQDNLLNGADVKDIGNKELGITKTSDVYTKNIVNALAYTITTGESETTYGKDKTSFEKVTNTTAYKPASTWISSSCTEEEGGATNAHSYYEQVMGTALDASLKKDDLGSGAEKLIACLNANGTKASVTFRFYLNGNDVDCFDACKGQTFSVALSFSSKASE